MHTYVKYDYFTIFSSVTFFKLLNWVNIFSLHTKSLQGTVEKIGGNMLVHVSKDVFIVHRGVR